MVTTLYLIRHGETEGAESRRYKGHTDVPLSSRGMAQMKEVGLNLHAPSMVAVYCSDLQRAVRSAEYIAGPRITPLRVRAEFRERNFGRWEGLTFDECRNLYPREFEAWASNPLRFSPLGGESTIEVRDRVIPPLESIVREHIGETIALVSHGGVNRVILCHYLGIPLENIFRIDQEFGAVNRIDISDGFPVVTLINGIYYRPQRGIHP